jgi:hypothetical protein
MLVNDLLSKRLWTFTVTFHHHPKKNRFHKISKIKNQIQGALSWIWRYGLGRLHRSHGIQRAFAVGSGFHKLEKWVSVSPFHSFQPRRLVDYLPSINDACTCEPSASDLYALSYLFNAPECSLQFQFMNEACTFSAMILSMSGENWDVVFN